MSNDKKDETRPEKEIPPTVTDSSASHNEEEAIRARDWTAADDDGPQ